MRRRRSLAGIAVVLVLPAWVSASTGFQSGGGTTAVNFEKIGFGPRPAAMGEAFTAAADGVDAVTWNPAGLASLTDTQLHFMHAAWMQDVSHENLGYAQPAGSGALGFSMAWLHAQSRRIDPPPYFTDSGPVETSGYGFTLAFANRLDNLFRMRPVDIHVGTAVKLMAQRLDTSTDYGFAADLGMQWMITEGLSMGAALQNLGGGTAGYLAPMTARAGTALHVRSLAFPRDRLTLALEGVAYIETKAKMQVGAEYRWALGRSAVFLRGGYRFVQDTGFTSGLTTGAGLDVYLGMLRLAFDYAYVKYGDLGNTHRLALTLKV